MRNVRGAVCGCISACDADREAGLIITGRYDRNNAVTNTRLVSVNQATKVLRTCIGNDFEDDVRASRASYDGPTRFDIALSENEFALGVGELLFELVALIEDGGKRLDHLVGPDLKKLGRLAHALILRGEIGARPLAGQRLDTAHAWGNAGFANDLKQSDITGAAHMGSTAKLDGIGLIGLLALRAHA